MSDVFTQQKRSEVMSRIRGRGNRDTEVALARLFRANGVTGWRRHYPVTGRPDFAFAKAHVAVFVDGCFWHLCPKCSNMPVNNRAFWEKKLGNNVRRDRLVTRTLRDRGWTVVRVWEHELRTPRTVLGRITESLSNSDRRANRRG
jgi:DNA mismatch endonuclease, patch repair protein